MKLIKIRYGHFVIVEEVKIVEGDFYVNLETVKDREDPEFGKVYRALPVVLKNAESGLGYKDPDYFVKNMRKVTYSTNYAHRSAAKIIDWLDVKTLVGDEFEEYDVDKIYHKTLDGWDGEVDSFTETAMRKSIEFTMECASARMFTTEQVRFMIMNARVSSSMDIITGNTRPNADEFIDEIISNSDGMKQLEWIVKFVDDKLVLDLPSFNRGKTSYENASKKK